MALLLSLNGRAQSTQPTSQTLAEFAAERTEYASRAEATVAVLASDSLAGRGYGPADGARRAARYVAGRFRELGLEPLGDSAGHSYYQHFPLPINTFPGPLTLALDGRTLRPGFDFIAAPDCPSARVRGRVVVLDTSWLSLDSVTLTARLRPRSLHGQVLVLRASDTKRLPQLSAPLRRWVESADAVLVREPKKLTASLARTQGRQPWLRVLDSAWTRGLVPRRATLAIGARFEPAYPAMNVIGRLRGNGTSDSVLIVTAHYDHLGQQGPAITFYGANDNASGTAMLLALAASSIQARGLQQHDLLFIAFGAEEAGLVGSEWCATHPPVPLPSIGFLLNLDLEGFGDGATVVNATLHPREFALLDSLSRIRATKDGKAYLTLKQRGRAANSDHYPFSERGVPAFFVYSLGGPGYYHDVRDRPKTLDLRRTNKLFMLLLQFLSALDAAP